MKRLRLEHSGYAWEAPEGVIISIQDPCSPASRLITECPITKTSYIYNDSTHQHQYASIGVDGGWVFFGCTTPGCTSVWRRNAPLKP